MTTVLRQVLNTFENTGGPLSLKQMARELNVEMGMLEGMIQHWVRKGRLRESAPLPDCGTCGVNNCPFIMQMPRTFELVIGDLPESEVTPAPACPHRS